MASTNVQSRKSGYNAEMDDAERASRDEITALQTRRLAWTLAHAYDNVAHYKKAFDKAGVKPKDFRQLADLKNFPFTVKNDLRDNYPFNMFAVPRENWSASTPLPAPPASRSWWDTPGPTSIPGRT